MYSFNIITLEDFFRRLKEINLQAGFPVKELWITEDEWNYLIADYKFHMKASPIEDSNEPNCKAIIDKVKILTCAQEEAKYKNKFIKAFSPQFA